MRIEKVEETKPKTQVITMKEDYQIPGTDIILEKGDKIEVLREYSMFDGNTYESYDGKYQLYISDDEAELIDAGIQKVLTVFDLTKPIDDDF